MRGVGIFMPFLNPFLVPASFRALGFLLFLEDMSGRRQKKEG
jgi:hypothetical protein